MRKVTWHWLRGLTLFPAEQQWAMSGRSTNGTCCQEQGNCAYTDWKTDVFQEPGKRVGVTRGGTKPSWVGKTTWNQKVHTNPTWMNMQNIDKCSIVQIAFLNLFGIDVYTVWNWLVSRAGQVVTYFKQQVRRIWFQAGCKILLSKIAARFGRTVVCEA